MGDLEQQRAAWQRLALAALVYDSYGSDWYNAMLRDLLIYLDHQQLPLEVVLAAAAARAGVQIRGQRLSIEQRLFAGNARPLRGEG